MTTSTQANGEPGAAARCASASAADAAARAAAGAGATSVAVHRTDGGAAVVLATGDAAALADAMAPHAADGLHLTATRRVLRARRTWPAGETTPGITQLYLTHRRPGLSPNDYHRYWEREHGPRALRHHLGLWGYAQVSVTSTVHGEHVDGLAVTQWARPEDLADRFTDGPVGDAVIRHDAARFTDVTRLARLRTVEEVLVDAPLPGAGTVALADARQQRFERPADEVWAVLGRFDGICDWWPGGFAGCATSSEHGPGMTRTLTRDDGSLVVERLLEYRPAERMLQLVIDQGLPASVVEYTCRYEVRPDGDGSRLDWYPRAVVQAEAAPVFGAIVDRGWPMVAGGLLAAVGAR